MSILDLQCRLKVPTLCVRLRRSHIRDCKQTKQSSPTVTSWMTYSVSTLSVANHHQNTEKPLSNNISAFCLPCPESPQKSRAQGTWEGFMRAQRAMHFLVFPRSFACFVNSLPNLGRAWVPGRSFAVQDDTSSG